MRPRPDQRHLAAQHVEELGQFIERHRRRKCAGPGHPRIVPRRLPQRSRLRPRVVHGAELPHAEVAVGKADTALAEQDRPCGIRPDEQRDQQDRHRQQHERQRCDAEIDQPFGDCRPALDRPVWRRRRGGDAEIEIIVAEQELAGRMARGLGHGRGRAHSIAGCRNRFWLWRRPYDNFWLLLTHGNLTIRLIRCPPQRNTSVRVSPKFRNMLNRTGGDGQHRVLRTQRNEGHQDRVSATVQYEAAKVDREELRSIGGAPAPRHGRGRSNCD